MYNIGDLIFGLRYSPDGGEAIYENGYYRATLSFDTLDVEVERKFGTGLSLMNLCVHYVNDNLPRVSKDLEVMAIPRKEKAESPLDLTQLKELAESTEVCYLSAKNLEQSLRNIVEIINVTNGEKGEN